MKMPLTSPSVLQGQPIPDRHAYERQDLSPALQWANVPANTKSLALICDDPDAPMGTWVHWVLYDLPPTTTRLPEGMAKNIELPGGGKQGVNDYKKTGYGGPCPPPGPAHRYFFKLYALDTLAGLKPGASKAELLKAMEGHILAEGQLMGTFQRK